VDWITFQGNETILSLNNSQKVIVADLTRGSIIDSNFLPVDTGSDNVPFRPSLIIANRNQIAVFHQALNQDYQAKGAGRIFLAAKNSSEQWEWIDQDKSKNGIQGVALNISNPVTNIECADGRCLIGGACYSSMGAECLSGIDEFSWDGLSVRHVLDLPANEYIAGGFSKGIDTQQVLICLKSGASGSAGIKAVNIKTGVIESTWDSGSSYCATFKTDREGQRVIALDSTSSIKILDSKLEVTQTISTPRLFSGMELINE
jgi:hypothetical protein